LDIKPDTKIKLKDGNVCKVIGQLEDDGYMVRSGKKGEILYCKDKDIVSVTDK